MGICLRCADKNCIGYDSKITECEDFKPETNADKIRSMTDEELADELLDYFAAFYSVEWSREELVEWLKQECAE